MELFHEYKNIYFSLVFKVLNMCHDGLSRDDIIKIIESHGYDEKLIGKESLTFEGMLLNDYEEKDNFPFLKQKSYNHKYYPTLQNGEELTLAVRFSTLEKQWLKAMLKEDMARTFLGEELVSKLESQLLDVPSYVETDIIHRTNMLINDVNKDFESQQNNFFLLAEAIQKQQIIRYTSVDKHGNEYKDKLAIPMRIEYSLKDEIMRVSVYYIEEKRPVMLILNNIRSLVIENNAKCNMSRKDVMDKMKSMKYCSEPLVLELIDKRCSMERCFMGFSAYERSTKCVGKNKYEVSVYYYTFDEDEVIRKVLSLGPYVVVKSPEHMRDKVIEKLKMATRYE